MPIILDIMERAKPFETLLEGCAIPPNKLLWEMENEAYSKKPLKELDNWVLIQPYSDGIKCYKKGKDIVVAIRGTADMRDVKADLQIIYSGLPKSARYKEDLKILKKIQMLYSPKRGYRYYGVAHSLGSAIMDELIYAGLIEEGISYNGAVDLLKFRDFPKNHRIYNEDDILYNLMGRFTKNPEVRKNKKGKISKILSYTPLGIVGNIKAHLSAFSLPILSQNCE